MAGTPSSLNLPARPREIKLDGIDPCGLWTADQLAQLALMSSPRKGTTTSGDDACSYDAQDRDPPELSLTIMTVLDHDATELLSNDDTVIQVAGFPAAADAAQVGSPRPCTVVVSTAQGQALRLSLNYSSTENHLSIEQACELTIRAATFATQTLQTQR